MLVAVLVCIIYQSVFFFAIAILYHTDICAIVQGQACIIIVLGNKTKYINAGLSTPLHGIIYYMTIQMHATLPLKWPM